MNYSLIIVGLVSLGLSSLATAEVQSLTSGELTETYIKDSTIIVTPAAKQKKKKVVTYTLSPGEPVKSESEEQSDTNSTLAADRAQLERAGEASQQVARETSLIPAPTPELAALNPRVMPYPNLVVPEGAFTFAEILGQTNDNAQLPFGDQLNFQSDGQQVTITIGNNLPGVGDIFIPERIQGGLVDLVPRDGGGFDLTLTIPKN